MKTMNPILAAATWFVLAGTGWAQTKPAVIWRPASPANFTEVSYNRGIQYVVIHVTEGSYYGTISWFQNPDAQVSAHYVVAHSGEISQMVADQEIAWHAGNWWYNVHSIGIEHEGWAFWNTWTDAQYRASARLTRWICLTYGIPMDRTHIIGHYQVPWPNTHLSCPGPYFNWDYYISLVRTGSTPATPPPNSTATSLNQAMKVTGDALNVRSGPGTGYSILGEVFLNQIYIATAYSNGWYKIYYRNNTGWVYGGYVVKVTGVLACKITGSMVNVRNGVNWAPIIGTASYGQIYHRVSSYGNWIQIDYGGGLYWIYATLQVTVGY